MSPRPCRRLENIIEVHHVDETPNFAKCYRAQKGARGQGIRYEKLVQSHLKRTLGNAYVPSPWFRYREERARNEWNWAQPDGLYLDFRRGVCTIFEVKYSHCPEAYFQLVDKYLPLLRKFLGTECWDFALCEVVRWYDRQVEFPTTISLCKDYDQVPVKGFNVHIWRPG